MVAARQQTEFFRGVGPAVLVTGATLQASPYVLEILRSLHLRLFGLLF